MVLWIYLHNLALFLCLLVFSVSSKMFTVIHVFRFLLSSSLSPPTILFNMICHASSTPPSSVTIASFSSLLSLVVTYIILLIYLLLYLGLIVFSQFIRPCRLLHTQMILIADTIPDIPTPPCSGSIRLLWAVQTSAAGRTVRCPPVQGTAEICIRTMGLPHYLLLVSCVLLISICCLFENIQNVDTLLSVGTKLNLKPKKTL